MAAHIHVGHNVPGYLPETDVMCFSWVFDALDFLRAELRDQQDYYYGHCEAETLEQREKGSECCDWCDVAVDVQAALSHTVDDASNMLDSGVGVLYHFSPPKGPALSFWAGFGSDSREGCELNEDEG